MFASLSFELIMTANELGWCEGKEIVMGDATILLVEGPGLGDKSLERALANVGYDVYLSHTGAEAVGWVAAHQADVIIFDGASLPAAEKEQCRKLRVAAADTPIIHTRKKGEKKDESVGASVYLMAPFTARKVLNRIKVLLPANAWEEQIVIAGDLTLFKGKRCVAVAGRREKRLTPKLALLLEEFLRHPNEVRTRRELMQNVWQTDYVGDTRTLDVHIRWVREAIEADPGAPERLVTVRGVGYLLRIRPTQE